ncbi:hypothetical protein LACDD01_00450 [Lactococcus sp. DD01]|nr:hypothetical protein LACDD01_00450 [Lactococcus sp. DD01]
MKDTLKILHGVKEKSQKLLDSMQTLEIPISFDHEAAQIISKIQVK